MMFGTRDRFTYRACASCGCLELVNPPADPSAYYPSNYYSMALGGLGFWQRFLLYPYMSRYWLDRRSLVGYLLCRGRRRPSVLEWKAGSQLLEVGSGAGLLLFRLRGLGFARLIGAKDLRYPGSIAILKRRLSEIEGRFEYIVLNHAFEHMDAPLDVLRHVCRLLAPDGRAIISTPIASSFAWREYGVDWVQLDAPRHLFVHSLKSVQILADQAGLRVADVVFDSTEFQFWGSEQYRAGIPLYDKRSYAMSPRHSLFTPEQIADFGHRADELNAVGGGDSASFYLQVDGGNG
jgi:SAM-dependent methyltransferase